MLQEATTWDLRRLNGESPVSVRIYVLFLFVVCIVTGVKLIRIWRAEPPFRLSRQTGNPAYRHLLVSSRASLSHWISCTLLGSGAVASMSLTDVCHQLLYDKGVPSFVIPLAIQRVAFTLTMTLVAVLFLFLVRWYMLNTIARLRQNT